MTRRPAIVLGCTAIAAAAGVWAGGAVTSSPHAPAALTSLELARSQARGELDGATTAAAQDAAERRLARIHGDAANALPQQRGALLTAAGAYASLASATSPGAYATAKRAVDKAEARLAAALRTPAPGDPALPPALPLILLGSAAAGLAVSTRGRTTRTRSADVEAAAGRDALPAPLPSHAPAWDTPPPGL
jgi:hypothetical protein